MKKLVILFFVLVNGSLFGQQSSTIRVDYMESISLNNRFNLDSSISLDLKGLLPDKLDLYNQLYVQGSKGIYGTDVLKMEEQQAEQKKRNEAEGGAVFIDLGGAPENYQYTDLDKQSVIEQRDFMGKMFLIEGKVTPIIWKMTGNKKTILGYEVLEATAVVDGENVTAWFAPSIKAEIGPSGLHSLPGLILEVQYINDQRTITAVKIDLNEKDSSKVKAPSKGKKVTEEQFDKMVEEKTKEMEQQFSGRDGGVIIKMD